jgi:hypothetical protein
LVKPVYFFLRISTAIATAIMIATIIAMAAVIIVLLTASKLTTADVVGATVDCGAPTTNVVEAPELP